MTRPRSSFRAVSQSALALLLALAVLNACGIRKPLIRPKDIPKYEDKRAKKKAEAEQDQQTLPDPDPDDTGIIRPLGQAPSAHGEAPAIDTNRNSDSSNPTVQ